MADKGYGIGIWHSAPHNTVWQRSADDKRRIDGVVGRLRALARLPNARGYSAAMW